MDKKTDALMLALHHIEDGAHNRRYIRHVIREALMSVPDRAQSRSDEEQPAQRKPLTDEQIAAAMTGYGPTGVGFPALRRIVRAIEAAHGIKENA